MQSKTQNKMYRTLLIAVLIIISVFISFSPVAAQEEDEQDLESCTQTLVDAQEVFANGQIELVPEILGPCLEKGFTKREKVAAYRLLALCHLYYDRTAEAAIALEKMLKLDPEYEIQDIDPSEFISLYETYRTTPVVIIGVKGGIGGLSIYDVTNYNDINSNDYTGTYSPGNALLGGISAEFPIIDEFSIAAEVFFNTYSYDFTKTQLSYATVNFSETVTGLDVPILLQWNILKNRQVIPYINAGGSMYFTLKSSGNLTRKDTLSGLSRELAIPSELDLTSSRNGFNFGVTGGVGVRIKDVIGNGYITFDVRYSRYFKDNIEPENRASNNSLTYTYMYTDNPIKLQNLQFMLGYKLPIYFPKQRKSAKAD